MTPEEAELEKLKDAIRKLDKVSKGARFFGIVSLVLSGFILGSLEPSDGIVLSALVVALSVLNSWNGFHLINTYGQTLSEGHYYTFIAMNAEKEINNGR